MPSQVASSRLDLAVGEALGVDPVHLDLAAVVGAGVVERLDHRQVGVGELVVLADERDPHRLRWRRSMRSTSRFQSDRSGARYLDAEVVEHRLVDALVRELERHLVDRVDVARRDDRRSTGRFANSAIFSRMSSPSGLLAAAHDHVRLDADAAQLLHGVLGRLGLELARVAEERHEREVHEHAAVAARGPSGTGAAPRGTAATRCRRPCRRSR